MFSVLFNSNQLCLVPINAREDSSFSLFSWTIPGIPSGPSRTVMRSDRMRSQQTEAGETRKGLRVDFGAQFNTRRRTVRLVCDFPFDCSTTRWIDGDLKAARLRRWMLGRNRVVFCFLCTRDSWEGDDPRRECPRVKRLAASIGAFAIVGFLLPCIGSGDDDPRNPKGGVRPRQRGLAGSLLQERVRAKFYQQRPRLQVPGLRAAR